MMIACVTALPDSSTRALPSLSVRDSRPVSLHSHTLSSGSDCPQDTELPEQRFHALSLSVHVQDVASLSLTLEVPVSHGLNESGPHCAIRLPHILSLFAPELLSSLFHEFVVSIA